MEATPKQRLLLRLIAPGARRRKARSSSDEMMGVSRMLGVEESFFMFLGGIAGLCGFIVVMSLFDSWAERLMDWIDRRLGNK